MLQQLLQGENKGFAGALCDSVYLLRIDLRAFLSLLLRGREDFFSKSHYLATKPDPGGWCFGACTLAGKRGGLKASLKEEACTPQQMGLEAGRSWGR